MPSIIAVKFAYAARDLWFDPAGSGALEGDHVICSTERGTEIGLATSDVREVSKSELGRMIGNATLKPILRVATDGDLARAEALAQKGEDALPVFRTLVSQSELDMKPVGVEYLFGGEKVVCYFAAEERVDFRQLVRDLSRELHERIDMRQIGVREEAAFVGGFGHCGQELCCARFGLSFEPVSIRMAKEQDLPLTSNKISGACGRLMCCLRYEFEAYRDFKGRAPKRNAVIETPLGKAKVIEYDTPKEQLALRIESGKVIRIPLAEMVASEAAVKKSEELHCPCRPDTVVRASLDKLSSPDVQMALAELDRKMGVVAEESFDEADLFVEAKPRRRRRGSAEAAPQAAGEQQPQGNRRTRRHRAAAKPAEGRSAQAQEAAAAPADKKPRRRRRKRSDAAEVAADQPAPTPKHMEQRADEAPASTTRRRRHHRRAAEADQSQRPQQQRGQQQAQKPQGQQRQQASSAAAQKPRRRPGDHGGQVAQQKPNAAQGGEATSAPKRRRRRRSNRGGANAEGTGGADGAGSQGGRGKPAEG